MKIFTQTAALRARAILGALLVLLATAASATTVVPTTDASLFERADVVVHGRVLFSFVEEAADGTPMTITEIEPMEVFKGGLGGNLILRQAGGELPDGRFFKLWGRPEFVEGSEVVVFAISRPEGDFQTAEMLLGKFDVWKDGSETKFAVAPLTAQVPEGVTVRPDLRVRGRREAATQLGSTDAPRELSGFADYLRNGARGEERVRTSSLENLRPVRHDALRRIQPEWVGLNSTLWRYNNNATAAWYTDGTANISGGGAAETQRALATWTNHAQSTINFSLGGSNPIHLNALSSPCGWSTALPPELGVIGCGGPRGSGTHSWRGETYSTVTGGEVWLRAYATLNQVSSALTESILLHELGHTLGLGHSDQGASSHDVCRGDESSATMRSTAQNRTTLGSDDLDAIRWLYGDGSNSCAAEPPPTCTAPSITAQPQPRTITAGQSATLSVTASDASSYQWYVGPSGTTSSPVAGATGSSLTVTPSTTATYWVRVTNSCGSVNSAAATVTVTAPTCTLPSIFSQPAGVTIERGLSATLSVGASNAASYQWYIGTSGNTSLPISGGNGTSITVAPSSTTSYWVRATNACGSANSSTATVTVYRNKRKNR